MDSCYTEIVPILTCFISGISWFSGFCWSSHLCFTWNKFLNITLKTKIYREWLKSNLLGLNIHQWFCADLILDPGYQALIKVELRSCFFAAPDLVFFSSLPLPIDRSMQQKETLVITSVSDPYHFDADPDPRIRFWDDWSGSRSGSGSGL